MSDDLAVATSEACSQQCEKDLHRQMDSGANLLCPPCSRSSSSQCLHPLKQELSLPAVWALVWSGTNKQPFLLLTLNSIMSMSVSHSLTKERDTSQATLSARR